MQNQLSVANMAAVRIRSISSHFTFDNDGMKSSKCHVTSLLSLVFLTICLQGILITGKFQYHTSIHLRSTREKNDLNLPKCRIKMGQKALA